MKENFHCSIVFSNELLSGLCCWGNYLDKRKTISESRIRSRLFNRPFEVLGITEKLLEDDKILVQGLDRFTKLDRIRDKMKQRVGIISNNGVITKLLNFQAVKQGDKTNRFRRNQIDWLKSNDYLKTVLPVKGEL